MNLHRALPALALALVASVASADDVGQHPAIFAARSLPAVNPSTFVVGHPASPQWKAPAHIHANHAHPAMATSRKSASNVDVNTFLVQPPAHVEWTEPSVVTPSLVAAAR
jgi:hypothetical protein